MPVVKEFRCMAHGDFESPEATCPHGCSGPGMVDRAFRTPVAIQTAGYRSVNRTFESLAAQHGLTDMRNAPGESMRRADWHTHQRLETACEMVGLQGNDVNAYFKPLSDFGKVGAAAGPQNSALSRDPATGRMQVMRDQALMTLGDPRATVQVAGKYDGTQAGLPAGDA